MKVLVTFSSDWADEFQAEGLMLLSPEQWEDLKAKLSVPQDWYFGTNEGFEEEILIDSCSVQDVSDEEAEVLNRLIPSISKYGFGQFPDVD